MCGVCGACVRVRAQMRARLRVRDWAGGIETGAGALGSRFGEDAGRLRLASSGLEKVGSNEDHPTSLPSARAFLPSHQPTRMWVASSPVLRKYK